MHRVARLILQHHEMMHLPHQMTVINDVRHIWIRPFAELTFPRSAMHFVLKITTPNITSVTEQNTPRSPNISPATKNNTHNLPS